MPHDTHEALVNPLIIQMGSELSGAPLSRGPYTIAVEVAATTSVNCQDGSFTPDLCVQICSLTGTEDPALTSMRPLILMETAYSQSNADVTKKLEAYVKLQPTPLAIFKIKIKDTYTAPLRSPSSPAAMRFMGRDVLSEVEFKQDSRRSIHKVVRDGIVWINVTGVELHLWLRLGDTPIDLRIDCSDHTETAYASGVRFFLELTHANPDYLLNADHLPYSFNDRSRCPDWQDDGGVEEDHLPADRRHGQLHIPRIRAR